MANQNPIGTPTATLNNGIPNSNYLLDETLLLQGFSDPDGDPLNVVSVAVDHGELTDLGNDINTGNSTYLITPETDYSGDVTVDYTVTDDKGGELDAVVKVKFENLNVIAQNLSKTIYSDNFNNGTVGTNLNGQLVQISSVGATNWTSADLYIGGQNTFAENNGNGYIAPNSAHSSSLASLPYNLDKGIYSLSVEMNPDIGSYELGFFENNQGRYLWQDGMTQLGLSLSPNGDWSLWSVNYGSFNNWQIKGGTLSSTGPLGSTVTMPNWSLSTPPKVILNWDTQNNSATASIDGVVLFQDLILPAEVQPSRVHYVGIGRDFSMGANAIVDNFSFFNLIQDVAFSTYELITNKETTNEGEAVTLTLKTTNVAPDSDVPVFFSGSIDAADIQDGLDIPAFHVGADGTAQITLNFLADQQTEGEEFLVAYLEDSEQFAEITVNDSSIKIENHPATGSVKIKGDAVKARILTATDTLKDLDGLGTVNYQWLRDGAEILDETAAKYKVTAHDMGSKISVQASFTDKLGFNETVTSVATKTVIGIPSKIPTNDDDQITGTAKNDSFDGKAGNDLIKGMAGNDTLLGNAGNDTLIGGLGVDKLTGGAGKDIFKFDNPKDSGASVKTYDTITDFKTGEDRIDFSSFDANPAVKGIQGFSFIGNQQFSPNATAQLRFDPKTSVLYGSTTKDTAAEFSIKLDKITNLTAADFTKLAKDASGISSGSNLKFVSKKPSAGDDQITGVAKAEKFDGKAGNDLIKGMGGKDTLLGGEGNDTLIGGADADKLTGGAGKDVFRLEIASHSKASKAERDTITDFKSGEDKIDLSVIDANVKLAKNQSFKFIGEAKFSANATGEVRFDAKTHVLSGNTNTDTAADFMIYLTGVNELVKTDFVL